MTKKKGVYKPRHESLSPPAQYNIGPSPNAPTTTSPIQILTTKLIPSIWPKKSWFHLLPWIPIYLLCSYISLFTFIFFLFFWQNILMARMINSTKSMTQIRLTTVAAWSSDSRQSKFFSPFTMPTPANRSHYGLPISMMHLNSWVSVYTLVHKSSSFLK